MPKKLSTTIAIFSDIVLVNTAFVLAVIIRFESIPWQKLRWYLPLFPFITFVSPVVFYIFELYDRKACKSSSRIFLNVFRSSLVIFIASMLFAYVFRATQLGKTPTSVLMLSMVLTQGLTGGWRIIRCYLQTKINDKDIIQKLFVLGIKSRFPSFISSDMPLWYVLNQNKQENIQIVRFSEDIYLKNIPNLSYSVDSYYYGCEPITELSSLISFIKRENIHEVFVESGAMSRSMLIKLAQSLAQTSIRLSVIRDQYEVLIDARITALGNRFPTIELVNNKISGWYMNFKRVADVVISIVGLLVLAVLYLPIALAIKLTSEGPVIFKQERAGLHGKAFIILKFRSMYKDAERYTGAVLARENDPRITSVGRIMRKFRLDELPNFINVLKGEMSFIGPRPERLEQINKLKAEYPFYIGRLQIKPGITGWAQVNGNYEDIKFKLHHDLYYIENISLFLDFVIFLKTIPTVILGKGAR